MLNNIKISMKIAVGFGIVVFLMLIIGYAGMSGMKETVDRVVKADDVNRLVKMTQQARQQEKNFIIRGDQEYINKVDDLIASLNSQAKETK
jgi:methyl-accepting chemotaxis protein